MPSPPVVLSIAGSDCCAGAGIQADLKTCATLGVHCLTAVTAVVAETPLELVAIEPVTPEILCAQVRLLLDAYPVAAIKTGMLPSGDHIEALAEVLEGVRAPVVVDPVLIASTGDALVAQSALAAYRSCLLPLADVITPNIPEAHALLGTEPIEGESGRTLAERLAARFQLAAFLTGGHAEDLEKGTDFLALEGNTHALKGPWIDCPPTHGTGCTLSAALAAGLASGLALPIAAQQAKEFVSRALRDQYGWSESPGIRALDQLPVKNLFNQGD